jgi:hypothetical protein
MSVESPRKQAGTESSGNLAPFELKNQLLVDLPIKWDYGRLFEMILKGREVTIPDRSHYMNLYVHYRARRKEISSTSVLTCRKIGEQKWIVGLVDREAARDGNFRAQWDPRYGRLKRYAQELQGGNLLRFDDEREAKYAAHAWRIYTPKAKRGHLRSVIEKSEKIGEAGGKAFLVRVKPREAGE